MHVELKCPECGADMVLRQTTKYTYNNGQPRRFYGCSRWPDCNAAHGAHPDGTPLGTPANKATKESRIKAHNAFDGYWRERGMPRNDAYKLLQSLMGLDKNAAHIGNFDTNQCEELVRKIQELKEQEVENKNSD